MAEEPVQAPGVREQFGRTRKAFTGLIGAHVNLAKAEFSEIADGLKALAAVGGCALFLLLLALGLLLGGLAVFLGEAIFGSIGWGVLDGTLLYTALGVMMLLALVDFGWGRFLWSFVFSLGIGLAVGGLLLTDWNALAGKVGTPAAPWLAIVGEAAILGIVSGILAWRMGRDAVVAAVVTAIVVGALFGLLTGVHSDWRVSSALGLTAMLFYWPIVAGYIVVRGGIDQEKLKARYVPTQTIETTKETVEWVREQLPLGPR